jgi:hypothetical protein
MNFVWLRNSEVAIQLKIDTECKTATFCVCCIVNITSGIPHRLTKNVKDPKKGEMRLL